MASPRPAAANALRIAAGHSQPLSSPQKRSAASSTHSASSMRGAEISFVPRHSPHGAPSSSSDHQSPGGRTPSGFGLSHTFPTNSDPKDPDTPEGDERRRLLKGHPVHRMSSLFRDRRILGCFVVLVLGTVFWLAAAPVPGGPTKDDGQQTVVVDTLLPIQPSSPPSPSPSSPSSSSTQKSRQSSVASTVAAAAREDLDDSVLLCAQPGGVRKECDWAWGAPGHESPSTVDHSREDIDPKLPGRKVQDLYTFQAGLFLTGEGPGAMVRIKVKELCCSGPQPLSYFRVTAHGAAQAASNPPLSLGPLPAAMGRGHQPIHLSLAGWGTDIDLRAIEVDEERVLQTFLLLPDPGTYVVQVELLHYNVSASMVAENFAMNSKEYNERQGMWINRVVKNVRGEEGSKITVPIEASRKARAYTDVHKQPWCGAEGHGELGGRSHTGTSFGRPLAGRWVYRPAEGEDVMTDRTALPPRELVEHSQWQPYFCQLDHHVPFAQALEKVQWAHFTGDSNTRHMFYFVCEMANGTLVAISETRVPRYLDPPHLCLGPSSDDNRPDAETGATPGPGSRWVLTYTNWFWGKQQTLVQPPSTLFHFREQCGKFVEQNKTGLFYGWPECYKAPEFIQHLDGPGVTYFGWGSHAAELGMNPLTAEYFATEEAFRLPYFNHHPVLFPLTTANTPQLIPDKFGRQQVMRNNERVHSTNTQLIQAVMDARSTYETRTPGGVDSPDNWLPFFDIFSPTHAAYEDLAADAVHFAQFFSYEEPKWLMHYFWHSPNFGPKRAG